MKKAIYSIVFLITQSITAQNTIGKDKTLPMVGYWHIGANRNVNVTEQTITNLEDNNDTLKSTYKAKWTVIDSTAKNYTINYTISNLYFSNLNDSFNQLLNELLPKLTFKYQTNDLGVFDTIVNEKEIKETLLNAKNKIDKYVNSQRNESDKTSKNYRLLNMFFQLYLEYEIPQDIKKIHHFYGLQYKKNTAYTYDTILIDPNSLRNFKAKSVFKLTNTYPNLDKVKFTCNTNSYKELKGNDRKLWKELKNGEFAGVKIRKGKMSIVNTFESEISLLEGYPLSIKFNSLCTAKTITTNETITITFAP